MTNRASGAEPILRVFDTTGKLPPPGVNHPAPMYSDASWTSANFGGNIFGLTLDSYGNIYVAASRVYGTSSTPGTVYRVDGVTGAISVLVELPNTGPGLGNLNYDCLSETLYVSNHEDGRIYQVDMMGSIVTSYQHSSGTVSVGAPVDPGEPDGVFIPLGDRVWAVQAHAGRLYYSVWTEDVGRQDPMADNEIWSVAFVDSDGEIDPTTAQLEVSLPNRPGTSYSTPVSDISFATTGMMLVAQRSMMNDAQSTAHQSQVLGYESMGGVWQPAVATFSIGDLANGHNSAGGVDQDYSGGGGYVWMTGDALDFYSPDVVYGVQGTDVGGGTVADSTIIDHDAEITGQDKTSQGDVEVSVPDGVMPPPPPA